MRVIQNSKLKTQSSKLPWRALLYALGLIALLGSGTGLGLGPASRALAEAAEHQAGVVVQYADGSVQTFCVPFAGDSIDGLSLLLKTGLDVQYEAYGMGGLVCKIGQDGCDYPGQPCVCQSFGPGGTYWSYHHLKNGQWQTSATGASAYKVRDGEVDGWAWTDGKPPSKVFTFAQLCGASIAPTLTPTPTRAPASTSTPTRTPRPHAMATATATATLTHAPITATLAPTPSPSPTQVAAIATAVPSATATPTPSATQASLPSPTLLPTVQPSPTPTLPPSGTQTAPGGEEQARVIAIIVGLGAAAAFVIWRVVAATTSGGRGGRG